MKFLDSAGGKLSLVKWLQAHVGGFEEARGYAEIHASDLTKEDFCPRRVALLDSTNKSPKGFFLPTALRTTFDMGEAVADLVREKWATGIAVGNWRCLRCGETRLFCKKPDDAEACCGAGYVGGKHLWKYEELAFENKEYGVTGSLDLMVDLKPPKLTVVELKIMAPEMFAELKAPLAEHRIRTSLYMFLVETGEHEYSTLINTKKAKVMYVSRGYGKKNEDAGNDILPFKEYDVARDDSALEGLLGKALSVQLFRKEGVMPAGICSTMMDKHAKNCSVCKVCFSGEYPAGTVVNYEETVASSAKGEG